MGILLCGLAVYRFTLIGSGHFFWGDEDRYLVAEVFVDKFTDGEYRAAVGELFKCTCRPAFAAISVLPVLMQRHLGPLLGLMPGTLESYDIVSAFNVLVSLGVTLCVWGVARAWLRCGWYALLVAMVFSLLSYSNVWIRHLMPYGESLAMFLGALWLLSSGFRSERQLRWRVVAAGALSALGYTCYPGHYGFVLLNAGVVLLAVPRRVWSGLLFGVAAAAVVAAFEVLAWYADTSFIAETLATTSIHATAHQGWPAEAYVFPLLYLRDVEGAIGIVLLALFAGFVVLRLWRTDAHLPPAARAGFVAVLACFVLHASLAVLLGKTRFYGRLVGMYLPFVTCGAVMFLAHIGSRRMRRLGVMGLATTSLICFVPFAMRYAQVVYPGDFLAQVMTDLGRGVTYPPESLLAHAGKMPDRTAEGADPELVNAVDPSPLGSKALVHWASHEEARTSGARFIGVNLKYLFYIWEKDHRFTPPDNYRVVAEAPHPCQLQATVYELYRPWERRRLLSRPYTMRVYERVDRQVIATRHASLNR
ncbi:MAG: hypothetical protein GY842_19245 [bacterium]|nr:hypothetical protein [bacterium]